MLPTLPKNIDECSQHLKNVDEKILVQKIIDKNKKIKSRRYWGTSIS
jgi:hypothetical protein